MSGSLTRYSLDYFICWTDVDFDPGSLGMHQGSIRIGVLVWNQADGSAVNWYNGTLEMELRPEIYVAVQKSGVPVHLEIDLPKGDFFLVTGVYDRKTGKAGTLEIPIHVAANHEELLSPGR